VKIGSGCLVWVGSVEKAVQELESRLKTKATLRAGWQLRRVARSVRKIRGI
jgi:hypothetical protein